MSTPTVGTGIDRLDARLKVQGKAEFPSETNVANVVHAIIVTSRIAKGTAAVDGSVAEKEPGVISVLTSKDSPKLKGATKLSGPMDRLLQLLQDDKVLYADHPIAVVVADTLEHARSAAMTLKADYSEAIPTLDFAGEMSHGYKPAKAGPSGDSDVKRGDPDVTFAAAPVKVEATYTTPAMNHNPMEPHGTIAVWQGDDHVTVYDSTQGVTACQKKVAEVFGIPKENVRIISHYVGGGFGCKGTPWSHVALTAMAAKVTKRAVKLVLTRSQMFSLVGHRPPTVQKIAIGADAGGKLIAIKHEVASHTSSYDEFVEPAAVPSRMMYATPNLLSTHRLVRLDVPTPTFMRAPGESTGNFALECAMDELAVALKMDPIALRLANYAEKDPQENKPWSSKSLRECYKRGAEAFGWQNRKSEPRSQRDGRLLVGVGMATASYPAKQSDSSASASMKADGTAVVLAGSQDIGTGTYTIMTQIAADALTLPIDRVKFDLGDSAFPETPVSGGSQTASSTGSAVKRACEALVQKLAETATADKASPLFGVAPADIIVRDGALTTKTASSKQDAFADLIKRARVPEIMVKTDTKEKQDRKAFSTHSFGAQFAEVKVDPDTYEVRVTRVVGAFAAGKILNSKTARSQLMGGIVWGIGMALLEHTARDLRNGRVMTRDLADYHVPVNADVPKLDIITVDEVDPHVNEIGAKGIGEIGITGSVAAIANAVYNATGRRVRDLPITPDKLF